MDSLRSSAMRSTLVLSMVAGGALMASACSTYDNTSRKVANAITPYRINIVQGNFVSREAAQQLHEGMTRDQVKFLLGTPLLTDVFHANRWDYMFSFSRGNTAVVQQRRFTVFFDGDKLVKFAGDDLPSEYELIAEIDGIKGTKKAANAAKPAAEPASTPAAEAAPQQAVAPEPLRTDAANSATPDATPSK